MKFNRIFDGIWNIVVKSVALKFQSISGSDLKLIYKGLIIEDPFFYHSYMAFLEKSRENT